MRIHTNQFYYDKSTKVFSQEASTLDMDNVPVTIFLVSSRTENVVIFRLVATLRDRENEIQGWEYKPDAKSVKGAEGTLVRIWND